MLCLISKVVSNKFLAHQKFVHIVGTHHGKTIKARQSLSLNGTHYVATISCKKYNLLLDMVGHA